jgi:hypothetical protein
MINNTNNKYEVLNPWAETDPISLRGISPRLTDLAGKKIGLLRNNKRAGEPILTVTARKLKEKFPDIEFSWYRGTAMSASHFEKDKIQEFEDWINGVDAVVAAVAD